MTMAADAPYRLPDTVFLAIVLGAVLLCVCHAARRAFRHPLPVDAARGGMLTPETQAGGEVVRHTPFQRFFHWANVVTVAVLLLSGLAIYRPLFLPFLEGPAAPWFAWHQWFTPVFLALVVAHLLYEYRAPDHIDHVWFGREECGRLASILRNFFGWSRDYPRYRKYHPAQILFHWAVAGNLLALVLTGSVLWKPLRALLPLSLLALGWDFIFYSRTLHGFFTATLTALLLTHIYFALFVRKNWAETRSMLTGKVAREEHARYHELPVGPPTIPEGRPRSPSPEGTRKPEALAT